MRHWSRLTASATVAAAWALAASPLPAVPRVLAGFAAVFLLPGLAVQRARPTAEACKADEAALALTLSIGIIGALGVACSALGLSIEALNIGLFSVSACAALATPARERPPGPAAIRAAAGSGGTVTRTTVTAIALLTFTTVVLAATEVNIARDRMWYAAYVTRLASGDALDWRDPVLGSSRVIWRFAYNAWLLALGAWSSLSGARAPWLIERCAPPLLVGLVPPAAYGFARSLFRSHAAALFTTLCTMVVLLASHYPYFAPEHTPLFTRIAEDKTAALLLLAPVATGLALRRLADRNGVVAPSRIVLAVTMFAVALTHGIVFLIVCVSLTASAAWGAVAGRVRLRRAASVLALVAIIALAPLALGTAARRDALRVKGSGVALEGGVTTDPVVRAHLRMHRLRDLPLGGPIVEPTLLADPLLVAALVGIAAAMPAAGTLWGAYACSTTLVFLALAFAPFIAPLFGRAVVPWMAYRALWGIPFGLLLAAGLMRCHGTLFGPPTGSWSPRGALAGVVLLAAVGIGAMPWFRLRENETRLAPEPSTLTLLDAITDLPDSAIIAAAPGLSELIPAYSGRAVLAFADRGTVAFSARRGEAERRLRANAAIVALHATARRARRRLLAAHHVTHVVFEGEGCDLGMHPVYADGRFTICAVRRRPTPAGTRATTSNADAPWTPQPSVKDREPRGTTIVGIRNGIECTPEPVLEHGSYAQWRRESRWWGRFTSVDCVAALPSPTAIATITLRGHLPRAREALIYAATARDAAGRCAVRAGAVELMRDRPAEIPLACADAREVRIRFASAYLPYINLRTLEIRGPQ